MCIFLLCQTEKDGHSSTRSIYDHPACLKNLTTPQQNTCIIIYTLACDQAHCRPAIYIYIYMGGGEPGEHKNHSSNEPVEPRQQLSEAIRGKLQELYM